MINISESIAKAEIRFRNKKKNLGNRLKPKKPNYNLKSYCIDSGQLTLVKRLKNLQYRLDIGLINLEEYLVESSILEDALESREIYLECNRIIQSSYQKKKRLFDRINKLLMTGNCLFLTLTFTDSVLDKTQEHIRRKYVQRFLKEFTNDYVANIDYGRLNEREHYHAVVQADFIDHKTWVYGNIDFEKIARLDSEQRLAKYIVKLGLHAVKETCRQCRVIYPKNRKN